MKLNGFEIIESKFKTYINKVLKKTMPNDS